MKKLVEILEGLFDNDKWAEEAKGYTKLAYYINSIKSGYKSKQFDGETYALKTDEFGIEDIWKIIEEKSIKKTTRSKIQKGNCYAELAKTGIFILKCKDFKNNMFKDAIGPAIRIEGDALSGVSMNISKTAEWGTKGNPTSRKDTYQIPHEIFDILLD